MRFDHEHYVPCLRWKQGEYQAVLRLSKSAKRSLTPFIEVPEIGFDFEAQSDKRTVDEHLEPFAKRVSTKWGQQPCFVDLNLLDSKTMMKSRRHPVDYVFNELRAEKCHAVPVTGLERDHRYQSSVKRAISKDKKGLCLRIGIELANRSSLEVNLNKLLKLMEMRANECDLVLDLGSPNFLPLEGFSKLVQAIIERIPYLKKWRTFILLGASFPQSMAEVKHSPSVIERYEWLLYKKVASRLGSSRIPTFGDYTISHPQVLLVDMRKVKPSASIRYAIDDAWFVVKGPNVRDHKFGQYKGHCRTVMDSQGYCGDSFSKGDEYIKGCAGGTETTGNLTTWRWVGTNHHLEKVVRDVASFYGSSGKP